MSIFLAADGIATCQWDSFRVTFSLTYANKLGLDVNVTNCLSCLLWVPDVTLLSCGEKNGISGSPSTFPITPLPHPKAGKRKLILVSSLPSLTDISRASNYHDVYVSWADDSSFKYADNPEKGRGERQERLAVPHAEKFPAWGIKYFRRRWRVDIKLHLSRMSGEPSWPHGAAEWNSARRGFARETNGWVETGFPCRWACRATVGRGVVRGRDQSLDSCISGSAHPSFNKGLGVACDFNTFQNILWSLGCCYSASSSNILGH